MSDFMVTVLTLSVSGTLLAFVLFILKPLLKSKFSKTFVYYIWLIVLLRLLLPLQSPFNIADGFISEIQSRTALPTLPYKQPQINQPKANMAPNQTHAQNQEQSPIKSIDQQSVGQEILKYTFNLFSFVTSNFTLIWMCGAIISIGWYILAYIIYTRRIMDSSVTPHEKDSMVFRKMSGTKKVRFVCSREVSTPMLIGLFHPIIIVPDYAYCVNNIEESLINILRHELMHVKRRDLMYKWFTAIVMSLHWFNPLMILIRKEIGIACEQSCDEAIIKNMPIAERKIYGNTLIAFASNARISAGTLATTLCAPTLCKDKKELKERLNMIVNYKKRPIWIIVISVLLTLAITGCGIALGAHSNDKNTDIEYQVPDDVTTPLHISGKNVVSVQSYYRMTMGGVRSECKTNVLINELFQYILDNTGNEATEPTHFGIHINYDLPDYYRMAFEISFMKTTGLNGSVLQQYLLYKWADIGGSDPPPLGTWLVYDTMKDKWYHFNTDEVYDDFDNFYETGSWVEIYNNVA